MEQVLSGLNSLLAIKPKQGFLLLIGGGLIVALHLWPLWPFDQIAVPFITLAAVIAMAGLVTLVVAWGSSLVDQRRAAKSVALDKRITEAAAKQEDDQAAANLHILDEEEAGDLLWVLLSGRQRFQGSMHEGSLRSLVRKQIVTMPMALYDDSVFEVRNSIWERRDAIIQDAPQGVRIPTRSPFLRS